MRAESASRAASSAPRPPGYFRTYEQVKAAMFALAAAHPDLVKVEDIGDSYEKTAGKADRDIFVLRLTSPKGDAATKPKALWTHGIHAREIATPEIGFRFGKELAEGYGKDAEVTALLDTREVCIVVMLNPDGHAVVEKGYAGEAGGDLMQRKNTSPPFGTDLNRNYPYEWGGPGASSSPRSETYRGKGPASEPEIQAVVAFAEKIRPSIFIDCHSHGKEILYPWGYTQKPTKDEAGILEISKRFAELSGYGILRSYDLYPNSGSSKDWGYGHLGIPSWTIETGTQFHQTDDEFEQTYRSMAPVMAYSAKIADAPYERAMGPQVSLTSVDLGAQTLTAQAVSPTNTPIVQAEVYLDPATAPGEGAALGAADGKLDGPKESLEGPLPQGESRLVYVRAKDAAGRWGPPAVDWLKPESTEPAAEGPELIA
jgi:hypothetical protein